MVTRTLLCFHCGSDDVIRHGTGANGTQRFRCKACGRTFRENPGSAAYEEARKAEILAAYSERTSLRGLTRIFGVSRTTVTTWLKKKGSSPAPAGGDASSGEPRGGDAGTG